MGYSLVSGQMTQAEATSTSVTATLTNNPTVGNIVIAIICSGGSETISVVDGNSNSYTATSKTTFITSSNPSITNGIYYFLVTSSPSKSIKATISPSNNVDIFVAEFTGNAASSVFENDATNNTTSPGTTVNLPSLTTVNNGDLLVSVVGTTGNTSSANSPWTGWTGGVPASGNFAAYMFQSSAGAQAVNFTTTSGDWNAMIAAFKASAALTLEPQNLVMM